MFMVYWTAMTWILTPIAIRMMGAIGFVYVQVFLSSTCFVVMAVAHRYLQIDLLKNPFVK
jgi:hypothetical protein